MPELPEVETIRRVLTQRIPGKVIKRVTVRDPRLRWPVDVNKLKRLVEGGEVASLSRRAKYLLIDLTSRNTVVIHLGMSGRLLLMPGDTAYDTHDHVVITFADDLQLRFRDPRRFGMVDAVPHAELQSYPRFTRLGLEPLERETTGLRLFKKARRSSKPIKNLIMDAHFLVGVGNIYANEALFHSGIHPNLPADHLNPDDWVRLTRAIQKVLRRAIDKGGTTLNDFVDSNGEMGYFQLVLSVYDREGEPCKRCGAPIERFVLGGRGTYFCPQCQGDM